MNKSKWIAVIIIAVALVLVGVANAAWPYPTTVAYTTDNLCPIGTTQYRVEGADVAAGERYILIPDAYVGVTIRIWEGDPVGEPASALDFWVDTTNTPGFGMGHVILMSAGGGNIYAYYPDGVAEHPQLSDTNLRTPDNKSLEYVELCWAPKEVEPTPTPPVVFKAETAWAANGYNAGELRYTNRGNWATYVEYFGVEKTTILFAGQTIPVGTVTFSAPNNGTITITVNLTGDWVFEEVSEALKVQDYADAPSGNPAPGLFDWKANATGSSFSIMVPVNTFYGVHANVAQPVSD